MSCCCGGETYAEKRAKKLSQRARDQESMSSGTFVGSNNGGNYLNNEYLQSTGKINFVYNRGVAPVAGGNHYPKGNTNYYQKHNNGGLFGNNNNNEVDLPTESMIYREQPGSSIFGKNTILQEEKSQYSTNSLPTETQVMNQKTQNDKIQTELLIQDIDNLNKMTYNSNVNSINFGKANHVRDTYLFGQKNFDDNSEINNKKNDIPYYSEIQSQYGNENNSNKINFSTSVVIAQNNKHPLTQVQGLKGGFKKIVTNNKNNYQGKPSNSKTVINNYKNNNEEKRIAEQESKMYSDIIRTKLHKVGGPITPEQAEELGVDTSNLNFTQIITATNADLDNLKNLNKMFSKTDFETYK